MLFSRQCYAPGEQFADPVYRPVGYDVKGIAEVAFWLHSVHFARPDQAVQQRSPLSSMIRTEEQVVFAAQTDHPQRIFSDVIVRLSPAIICIVRQRLHWFRAYANAFASSECRDRVFIFSRSQLSRISAAVSFSTDVRQGAAPPSFPYLCLDGVQFADPFQRFSVRADGCERAHRGFYGGREPNRRLPLSGSSWYSSLNPAYASACSTPLNPARWVCGWMPFCPGCKRTTPPAPALTRRYGRHERRSITARSSFSYCWQQHRDRRVISMELTVSQHIVLKRFFQR